MPTQRIQLYNNEIYHIVLRAVGDSKVFVDRNDYYRGIFSIYEFNTADLVEIRTRREERKKEKASGGPTPVDFRELLVEVLAFCFMPNNIHLLLKQLKDNGISQFIQKVGTGYATYFNRKYSRKGHLFNRFKAVYIRTDDQLRNVFNYIHCNPLSLIEPGWKESGVQNEQEAINFLEQKYRWSSYFDYIGKQNFPSVTSREFLMSVIGVEEERKQSVRGWIRHKKEIKDFIDITLD